MNKKVISIAGIVLVFILVVGTVYFVKTNSQKDDVEINSNGAFMDWVDNYSNVQELYDSADLVIKGKKVDSYTEQRVNMIFTNQIIEVNKIYKGDLGKGDKIEVLQTGGKLNNITTAPANEAPLLENKANYLLFLEKTESGYYLIMGGFQGVAMIKNDKVQFNVSYDSIAKELKDKTLPEIEKILTNK